MSQLRLSGECNGLPASFSDVRHGGIKVRIRLRIVDENGGGPRRAATKESTSRRARSLARDVAEVFGP
jgi:hypothetical protein